MVYKIPCKRMTSVYVIEVWRLDQMGMVNKVKLCLPCLKSSCFESAEKRMGKEVRGLARHSTECDRGMTGKMLEL